MNWCFAILSGVLAVQAAPLSSAPVPAAHPAANSASFDEIAARAMQAWNEKHDEEALQLFHQGLRLHPDWQEGLWYAGAISYQEDKYRDARDELRRYLAQKPRQAEGWALVGLSDYKLREFDHANEDLHRAISLGLDRNKELLASVSYYSALLLTRQERFNDSAALLYLLSQRDEGTNLNVPLDIPLGLNALGYALLPEEIPPDRVELVRQTGTAVLARFEQQRDRAKTIFSQLLKSYPDEQGLHFQYGLLLLDDRDAAGVREMKKALELSPSNPEPRLSLSQYYLDADDLPDARTYADQALALDAGNATAHLLEGRVLTAQGDTTGAIEQFESARRIAPSDTRALWELTRAYNKAGRKQEAAEVARELDKLGDKPPARQ